MSYQPDRSFLSAVHEIDRECFPDEPMGDRTLASAIQQDLWLALCDGLSETILCVRADNPDAIRLYERLGFRSAESSCQFVLSVLRALTPYLRPDKEILKLTFWDPEMADACRTAGLRLNYELIKMHRVASTARCAATVD